MKYIKNIILEILNYSGKDKFKKDEVFFHGTSLIQYNKIKQNKFIVDNLYITTDYANVAQHYAYDKSVEDDSDAVIIVLNSEYLKGHLKDDFHGFSKDEQEDERQIAQYIFNGNIKDAIFHVENLSTDETFDSYKTLK